MGAALPWAALLEAGLGRLRLTPEAFWALTPFEIGLMLGGGGERAMARDELSRLMARFPDARGDDEHG
jgi:uncharacterized phage protein (TIGR02216 family)